MANNQYQIIFKEFEVRLHFKEGVFPRTMPVTFKRYSSNGKSSINKTITAELELLACFEEAKYSFYPLKINDG